MVSASYGAYISGRPKDKFVDVYVRFGDNTSIQGCATCIYNGAEDSCGRQHTQTPPYDQPQLMLEMSGQLDETPFK